MISLRYKNKLLQFGLVINNTRYEFGTSKTPIAYTNIGLEVGTERSRGATIRYFAIYRFVVRFCTFNASPAKMPWDGRNNVVRNSKSFRPKAKVLAFKKPRRDLDS